MMMNPPAIANPALDPYDTTLSGIEATFTTIPRRVRLYTHQFEVEGTLHLNLTGKHNRLLSRLMQNPPEFLSLTDVVLRPLSPHRPERQVSFLQVSSRHIEVIELVDDTAPEEH